LAEESEYEACVDDIALFSRGAAPGNGPFKDPSDSVEKICRDIYDKLKQKPYNSELDESSSCVTIISKWKDASHPRTELYGYEFDWQGLFGLMSAHCQDFYELHATNFGGSFQASVCTIKPIGNK
jgi:hypothetical protein